MAEDQGIDEHGENGLYKEPHRAQNSLFIKRYEVPFNQQPQ